MVCTEDIKSVFFKQTSKGKEYTIYAKRGEVVEIVSDHGDAVICERKNKERFPTRRDKLI